MLGEPGKLRDRGSGAIVASYSWTAEMIADHVRASMKIREINSKTLLAWSSVLSRYCSSCIRANRSYSRVD